METGDTGNKISKYVKRGLLYVFLFIFGALTYYYLETANIFKQSMGDSNSVQELASKKVEDIDLEIEQYKQRDVSSKSLMDKLDHILQQITTIQRNDEVDNLIKNHKSESDIYKTYTDPIVREFSNSKLFLDNKYSMTYSSTYWRDVKKDDKQQSQLKEIDEVEEVSKVYYSVFPDPQFISKASRKDTNYAKIYSDNSFAQNRDDLFKNLSILRQDMNKVNSMAVYNVKKSEEDKKKFLTDLESLKSLSINKVTLYVAIPLFAIIILVLFTIPRLYPAPEIQKEFFEKNTIKDVITIFMLTTTIILLGLSKILTEQVIGTLLGGISVYVLEKGLEAKRNLQSLSNANANNSSNAGANNSSNAGANNSNNAGPVVSGDNL